MTQVPLGKLVSHRLRGFAPREHDLDSLTRVSRVDVPYLEIDTRATADGGLFVGHDPLNDGGTASASLDRALALFAEHARPDQRLCLDIKDAGTESRHLDAVRAHGLEDRIVFVSWCPQVLLGLDALGTRAPLFLSHLNLRFLGGVGAALGRLLAKVVFRLGGVVVLGQDRWNAELGSFERGYQHCLVAHALDRRLAAALARNGGGILVFAATAGPSLRRYCRVQGLKLGVFNTRGPDRYARWAVLDDIFLVFSDDAPEVAAAHSAEPPTR